MQLALRPFATAGVALAGASILAVTPVAPPLPDVQVPAVQLTSATDLLGSLDQVFTDLTNGASGSGGGLLSSITDVLNPSTAPSDLSGLLSGSAGDPFVNPITEWISVLTTAFDNIQTLAGTFLADPFPVLSVVIANQIAYAETLGGALQGAGSALVTGLEGLPAVLQTAFTDLLSGDVADAINGPFNYLFSLLIPVGFPLIEAIVTVSTSVGGNIDGVLSGIFEPLLLLVLSPIYPIAAVVGQFASTAQDFVNSVSTGDFVQAVSDVINAPAALTGAFLNGTDVSPITDAGLLTSPFGFFANLLGIGQAVASDITPFTDPSAAATASDSLTALPTDLSTMLSGSDVAGLSSSLLSDIGALVPALGQLPTDLGTVATDLLTLF